MDIDLKALGLAKAFPRLAKLQDEIADLQRQVAQANNEVRRLESALEVARAEDVAAQAKALRGGKAAPKTTREDKVQRELETARRNAAVLRRAVEDAQGELSGHMGKHGPAVYNAVVEARNETARQLARHAKAASALFGHWSDMHYTLKDLAPPPSVDETSYMGSSVHVVGVHTTQSGPERGDVEGTLGWLANLAPPNEEASDAA